MFEKWSNILSKLERNESTRVTYTISAQGVQYVCSELELFQWIKKGRPVLISPDTPASEVCKAIGGLKSNTHITAKQMELINDFKRDKLERINILCGAVRSGKTWISLILWGLMIAHKPRGTYLMTAKTLTALKRNCLDVMANYFPIRYSLGNKTAKLYGATIYLEGANDSRSEGKIRGLTLDGAYIDEATIVDRDYFTMLLSRLSKENSKLICTTNPDSPNHWLNTDYISRAGEISAKVYNYLITDNDTLTKEYVENISKEYIGVYYERYILGKWVTAEGLIYRIFADDNNRYVEDIKAKAYDMVTIGIDYGASQSSTVYIATGVHSGYKGIDVLMEKKIDGINSPEELYEKFYTFYLEVVRRYGRVNVIYADYGALGQVLTKGLRMYMLEKSLAINIVDCSKDKIVNRIQFTLSLLGGDKIKINRECINLINALNTAVWEDGKDDVRLDDGSVPIDFLDAFEYSICRLPKGLILHGKEVEKEKDKWKVRHTSILQKPQLTL